jgi:hypothetical protein
MAEKECHFVSSRGILNACDVKSAVPISSIRQLYQYNWSNLTEKCTVYICSSAIPVFAKIINKLPCKIILVTGDCDECCPMELFSNKRDFERFVKNEKILHWFSQNLLLQHPKMTQIPIGLDYHTMVSLGNSISPLEQETQLLELQNHSLPFFKRIPKIYANFHFTLNTKFAQERRDALAQISKDLIFYEPTKIERLESWKHQVEYAFVASPHGNSLDCHRTWEALCLGCIPIVKTSPLDDLYEGLPVLIVGEWRDICESLLIETMENMKDAEFLYEKLTLQYWMDTITNHTRENTVLG